MCDEWDTPSPHASIAYCVAGYVAEEIADPEAVCCLWDLHWLEDEADEPENADLYRAVNAARDVYASEGRARLAVERSWARVDRWLRQSSHWACAEEIAAALLRDGEVSGRAIYECAGRHGVRPSDRRLLPRRRGFFHAEARLAASNE